MYDIKIGFKCNNNCKHCVVASKRFSEDVSFPEIKRLLSLLPPETDVQITGGEPSIYKDTLLKILYFCKERNLRPLLQTNGTGFSDLSFAKECAPLLEQAHIAIHSCDPEVHDTIVGSTGMWRKTIQGFDNLFKEGVHCTSQTVLSKYNINTLYNTFSFIQKRYPATKMSMTYPHLMGNAYTNREQVAFRYSDYKEEIQKTLKDFHKYIFTESIPFCYLYPYMPDSCIEEILGTNSFQRTGADFSGNGTDNTNINYNFWDLRSRKKAPRCKECIFNEKCVGVWKEYIELFKNNLDLYPIKEKKDEC